MKGTPAAPDAWLRRPRLDGAERARACRARRFDHPGRSREAGRREGFITEVAHDSLQVIVERKFDFGGCVTSSGVRCNAGGRELRQPRRSRRWPRSRLLPGPRLPGAVARAGEARRTGRWSLASAHFGCAAEEPATRSERASRSRRRRRHPARSGEADPPRPTHRDWRRQTAERPHRRVIGARPSGASGEATTIEPPHAAVRHAQRAIVQSALARGRLRGGAGRRRSRGGRRAPDAAAGARERVAFLRQLDAGRTQRRAAPRRRRSPRGDR